MWRGLCSETSISRAPVRGGFRTGSVMYSGWLGAAVRRRAVTQLAEPLEIWTYSKILDGTFAT